MTLHVPSGRTAPVRAFSGIMAVAHIEPDTADPVDSLTEAFADALMAQVLIFAPTLTQLETLIGAAQILCPDTPITGCTTAGQIGTSGYEDDRAVVVGLPQAHFATRSVVVEDLARIDAQGLIDQLVQTRTSLERARRDMSSGFAFLLVDGLSLREDVLTAMIAPGIGSWPLFGGSAGDGARFSETFVAHEGRLLRNAAVVTFVATNCETEVFSLNHLEPTDQRMVVTDADPERRIVKEINAEPAAREYARIVGKDPDQLDEFTFAAHPVVVRLGDTHHVRAIQRVNDAGELVFFAAIDEGMVLTMATPTDIAQHLDQRLGALHSGDAPFEVLACDCILRRIEAEQVQALHRVSEVLARHKVVGFSTYGEQIGTMHVNHTMTGVALRKPAATASQA
ncbi:GfdT protein [Aliishimia ponticola]|uniref:GfdT protein n=1 Tax=Aliishimia ponticola TaxID=2499833 RepID=A0A4S4N9N0_9RHOB|nr:FIST N-terminal domain-containing protein [Aliishimia ponticola]THH35889.1 GfdT protein [Aliishimia ponticola]